jgi:autotransporter-associated beta strand protein
VAQQATSSAGYQVVFQGVSGTAATFKAGNGTLIWSGSNSYSGPAALNVGIYLNNSSLGSTITQASPPTTLGGSGTFGSIVSTSGSVQPGASVPSVGVLSASGAITLGGSTSVVLQVSGTGQGVGYDALVAGGTLDYGNAIVKLDSLPGTAFANGSVFQLFGAGSFQNGISSLVALTQYDGQSITFSGPGGGGEWTTGVLGNGQTLTFTPSSGQLAVVPEPASCVVAFAALAFGACIIDRRRRRS